MKNRKTYIGKITSDKMTKTVTVSIDRTVKHPRYKKYLKRTHHLMAHDEENTCRLGDEVKLIETRPLSARKRWVVIEVLKRGKLSN